MDDRRANLSLGVSLISSGALHLAVIVPLMLAMMTPASAPTQVRSEIASRDLDREKPEKDEEDEPRLGIDADTPSSLTWVGYEEYEEHLARLSEVEQAAFRMHESGLPEPADPQPDDAPPDEALVAEPSELPTIDQPEPVTEEAVADSMAAQAHEPVEESTEEPSESAESAAASLPRDGFKGMLDELFDGLRIKPGAAEPSFEPGWTDEPIPAETPGEDDEPAVEPFDEVAGASLDEPAEAAEREEDAADAESSAAPTQPAEERESAREQPPASSLPEGEPDEGDVSDREADATSTVDVPPENWRLGRPLAASGVELKPQRPEFTLLQQMSASPGNPLVVIRFGSDGVPRNAEIVRSSGNHSVDAFLETSLYRWRASGEEIENLAAEETFDVRIRIIFNPRALRREQAQEQDD